MRQPVGVCEKCGRHIHVVEAINGRCGARIDGKRCTGGIGSRLNGDDWTECPACRGSGRSDDARCEVCQGDGLIDARP